MQELTINSLGNDFESKFVMIVEHFCVYKERHNWSVGMDIKQSRIIVGVRLRI